jgi:hypothetical protein
MEMPSSKKLVKKIGLKIKRTFIGLSVLLITYFYKKFFFFKFRIIKFNYSAHKITFNLSMHCDKDGRRNIFMAREYFHERIYNDSAALYIGESNSLFDVTLKELDTSLLLRSLTNFVRLEDPRCFEVGGRFFAFCACICKSKTQGLLGYQTASQILIEIYNCQISSYKLFKTKSEVEKNWVVYSYTESYVDFVYSISPFRLIRTSLSFDISTEEIDPGCRPSFMYRNSTNYVTIQNTMYSVGHSTIDLGMNYVYVHFFIKLDHGQEVLISRPFIFKNFSNEFAMCIIERADQEYAIMFSDHEIGNYAAVFRASDLNDIKWFPLK